MTPQMSQMMMALSLGFAAVILATQIAHSAPQCAVHAVVVETLAQSYGETRRSQGIAANNTLMELFASDATGTWTLTVTTPDGTTCLVASGEGYDAVAARPIPKGTRA